jgi:hypothetical protein
MLTEKQKLNLVMRLGIELAEIKDVDVLLERILHEARGLVHADAGSIYIKENETLKFSYTQNETQQKKLPAGKKLIYSTSHRSFKIGAGKPGAPHSDATSLSRACPIPSTATTTMSRGTGPSPC